MDVFQKCGAFSQREFESPSRRSTIVFELREGRVLHCIGFAERRSTASDSDVTYILAFIPIRGPVPAIRLCREKSRPSPGIVSGLTRPTFPSTNHTAFRERVLHAD